jgi:hypothetical protein
MAGAALVVVAAASTDTRGGPAREWTRRCYSFVELLARDDVDDCGAPERAEHCHDVDHDRLLARRQGSDAGRVNVANQVRDRARRLPELVALGEHGVIWGEVTSKRSLRMPTGGPPSTVTCTASTSACVRSRAQARSAASPSAPTCTVKPGTPIRGEILQAGR